MDRKRKIDPLFPGCIENALFSIGETLTTLRMGEAGGIATRTPAQMQIAEEVPGTGK